MPRLVLILTIWFVVAAISTQKVLRGKKECKHGHRYREAEDGQDKEDVAHGSGGLGQVILCLYALRCV